MKSNLFLVVCAMLLLGCSKEEEKPMQFRLLSAAKSGIYFQNSLVENDSVNILNYEYLYNGGGVGVGHFNNDSLPDLFFGGNMTPSKLYLNDGNLRFEDHTLPSTINTKGKWITGISVIDINQDGFDDLYLCRGGMGNKSEFPNLLYLNNGDATFTEAAQEYGLADKGESIQALFFDYDKDGDLDMYLLTGGGFEKSAIQARPILKDGQSRNTDRLYRNDFSEEKQHAVFTNVSAEAGITIEGFGLGVAVIDANNDQWPDLYVSNDYLSSDLLYINNRDGSFSEESQKYLGHTSHFSMGNDVADVNNDGLMDIITMDMLPQDLKRRKLMSGANSYDFFQMALRFGYGHQHMRNMLHRNNGDGTFSELGQLAGVDKTDWSWAPLFADFDNDGKNDLYVTNGFGKDITDLDFVKFREQGTSVFTTVDALKKSILDSMDTRPAIVVSNFAYQNKGDFKFEKSTTAWGLSKKSISSGAVYADLDLDGDLDLVVNNIDQPAFVFENRERELDSLNSNFIQVKLDGILGNRDGVGAKVTIYADRVFQTKLQQPYRGFQSSVSKLLHFGLSDIKSVDSIVVHWPDQLKTVQTNVPANERVTLSHTDAVERDPEVFQTEKLLTLTDKLEHHHRERPFNDYAAQPLLLHNFSNQGPCLAVGDLNADGREDVFVGGAYGSMSTIYLQRVNGSFDKLELPETEIFEDTDAYIFDANGDGLGDIYVTSGGSERFAGHEAYQDRLYIHTEDGFTESRLPLMNGSNSTVSGADFDQDGDIDLFVGGRLSVGRYPEAPQSYILENRNGTFTDVTDTVAPEIAKIGMITDAIWTDFNSDSLPDLVLAGEFMPLTFLKNTGNRTFQLAFTSEFAGLWRSLEAVDIDQDGDMDFVAGNLGLNSFLDGTHEKPLQLHYADFDGNGAVDPIFSEFEAGNYYPVASLDQLAQQLPKIKKEILYYNTFASTTTAGLLQVLGSSNHRTLEASELRSSLFINDGKGNFEMKPLPLEAQIAPINSILATDFNGDGLQDLLLAGNDYHAEVVNGRYDASYGTVLMNLGSGKFKTVLSGVSGFSIKGDVRALQQVTLSDSSRLILAGINNDSLKVFRQNFSVQPGDFKRSNNQVTYRTSALTDAKKGKIK